MTKIIKPLTGVERKFADDEIIVSKTDAKGRIVYVNDVFMKVSGYSENEAIGQPHSMVRNPEMPRCVFKLLWDTIESGKEIFAYVNNCAKNGDHYWVFAHVTPTFDARGQIIGYHSNRRAPRAEALEVIKPIYAQLLEIENRNPDRKAGMEESSKTLFDLLSKKGIAYEELMFAI
jgi:PAS domain S-box-containing protein